MDAQMPNTAGVQSPSALAPEALTKTVLLTDQQLGGPEPQAHAPFAALTTVTETVLLTDQQAVEPVPTPPTAANGAESVTQTDPVTDLVTLEVYFTDAANRRIAFSKAVYRQGDGPWRLHPHAKIAFSVGERDRPCLAGKPGAWPKFYGARSPTEHGYDPDLVVMYWDPKLRRGRAASATMLRDILGDGWKENLREMYDGKR
jgi:hypothetical protein